MSVPSWQKGQAEEEWDYEQTMKRLGEAEEQRMAANFYLDGDILGVDDGWPGIGWAGWFGGFTCGVNAHLLYYVLGLIVAILIVIVGQTLKHTAMGQKALQQQPAGQVGQSAAPQTP